MLDRSRIVELLTSLDQELAHRGVAGELFLVGGGAMVLAYDREKATRDLDAVFEPKSVIYEAAAAVAARAGLPEDWLNDAVKGFMLGEDEQATVAFEGAHLRVRVASPPYLFVMKAAAARAERDADDLLMLYRLCGFSDVQQALDHVERVLGPARLTPRTALLLEELLQGIT